MQKYVIYFCWGRLPAFIPTKVEKHKFNEAKCRVNWYTPSDKNIFLETLNISMYKMIITTIDVCAIDSIKFSV